MYGRVTALAVILAAVSVILAAVSASTLEVALAQQNSTTTAPAISETKPFLTVEKPILGFEISYPSDWSIADKDFIISFRAPNNTALVTLSITNLSSNFKANFSLGQYSLNQINTIKSVEAKRVGNFFKLIESKPYLLSGQPGHEILFLNGTSTDTTHDYTKTLLAWSIVEGKVYQIKFSAKESEYSNFIHTVFYMIDSFRLL